MKNPVFKGSPLNTSDPETVANLSNPNSSLFIELKAEIEPEVRNQFAENFGISLLMLFRIL